MKHITILVVLCIVFISCSIPVNHPDPFYSACKDWDAPRFPLIKPYDVLYLGQNEQWVVSLHSTITADKVKFYTSINDVQKITVVKEVIMIYSHYEKTIDESNNENSFYWFVIIPNKNIAAGFNSEDDFLSYLNQFGIVNINWESPEDINKSFLSTGCLDWIPGCFQNDMIIKTKKRLYFHRISNL